jgi:hypothetical protein
MNTIKLETTPHVNIILPRIELGQKITVHNPNTGEIITFKNELEAVIMATEAKTKRWKPVIGHKYGYINDAGHWIEKYNAGDYCDIYRHETGNCYQPPEKERAIWEQITHRKYETALWDAADWVETCDTNPWCVSWSNDEKKLIAQSNDEDKYYNIPRFATKQSAIDAHTRILGDDAESYFKGRG